MKANVILDGIEYNYHVTRDGRVFSLNYNRTGEVKELKYGYDKDNYKRIILCKDGNHKNIGVAKLVALAYIPNPNNKPTVDHINRVKTDDRVENLRWATQTEQNYNRDKYVHPKNIKGSKPVKCIETGVVYPSTMEIERQLGFSRVSISACCRGERKSSHGCHWQYI